MKIFIIINWNFLFSKMNSTDTNRSMLTGEQIEQTKEKSSRSLWGVSMCSLVAIASLSAVLYADRTRIAQLEEELSNTHSVLSRPEVMNRVLALAQVSGSSTSVSGGSVSGGSVSGGSVSGGSVSAGGSASAGASIGGSMSSSSYGGSASSSSVSVS